jgi:hypothetical protein
LWVDGTSEAVTDVSGDVALVPNGEALEVGRRGNNSTSTVGYFDGLIAEVGIWGAVLTDAEVASLAKGVSPLMVRPQSLVAYYPLYGRGSTEPDYINGLGLTPTNSPVAAEHPRAYRPWSPATPGGTAPVAAGGGDMAFNVASVRYRPRPWAVAF